MNAAESSPLPSAVASNSSRISAWRLIAYAGPTSSLQLMMVPLLLYLPPAYYSEAVGLGVATVGLMFILGRAFEAVSDPLIGALSDRTRGRFGPRRPWIVAGTPLAVAAAWFLLTPVPGTSAPYLLAWLVVFYAGWTMVFIPHQTWGGELASDYHERTRVAGFRETGTFIGFLLASVVPLIWWKYVQGVDAPSFLQIVQSIGAFFAISLPILVIVCLAVVPAGEHQLAAHPPSWRELYAILGRNRPFRRLIAAYAIDRVAMGIYFAAQPLLIGVVLDMLPQVLWIALGNSIAAAVFAPLWIPITHGLGKHRSYCLANGITMCAYAILFFCEPGQLWLVIVANAILGFGNGGTMITPPAMAADTVDYDELRSGVQQMGGHMAFLAFVFKAGMAAGLVGLVFISFFGYAGGGQQASPQALLGIRICASWLPIALLLPAIAMMWNFPIDASRQSVIRRRLDARHARRASAAA